MARRIALFLILVAAGWFLATHLADVSAFVTTARGGSPEWLLVALALQVGYYTCYVLTYRQSFASAGVERPFTELVPVVLASVFVNTVVPSAGTAGPGLIVDDSARRGHSLAASATATLVASFTDFAGFAVVMAGGFTYLAIIKRLTLLEVVAAAGFTALVLALGGVLLLAGRSPARLERLLVAIERSQRRLAALAHLREPGAWASGTAEKFAAAVGVVSARRRTLISAWAASVAGHTLDLGCFVAIGFAFGWRGIGALVAGYAVGIVVWLVSIVPQGVGVVEGAVGVLLASLGVPGPTAAAISLTFRGMTLWLPVAIGSIAMRKVASFSRLRRPASSNATARASAVLISAIGIFNVLSGIMPERLTRLQALERYLPLQITYGRLAATLAGISLVLLSRGLWRHKRSAHVVTLALLAISSVGHIVKGPDWGAAAVPAAVLVWLLMVRGTFYARPDPPSIRQGLRVLLAAFVAVMAYGVAGFWLLDRQFSVNFGLSAAIRQTVAMFVEFYNPGLEPITGLGRYFADSIYLVGGMTFGFALLMLLRPVVIRRPATAAQRRRAAEIISRWAVSSLSPMALLPDKAYWFSPGGSVVAYVVSGEIAMVLGDAMGPDEDLTAAVIGFESFAEKNGWRPVFYEIRPERLDAFRELGFSEVHTGDEAIVDLRTFDLAGKSHKSLRNTLNKLEAEGVSATVIQPPASSFELAEIRDVSDAWLSVAKGPEKRFAMGWFDESYLRSGPIMVVRDASSRVVAFANILTVPRRNEATIDLMRHVPEAPHGTMDFLFVRLFEWARDEGFDTFNLGVSFLAGVGDDPDDAAAEKFLKLVYDYGNAFYGFKGLRAYKDKFDPVWEPRYIMFPKSVLLPAALATAARVTSAPPSLRSYFRLARRSG